MSQQIRLKFGTWSYDLLVADDDSIIENWPYPPAGRKWEVETDGIIQPYVRRDMSLGASAKGQGLLNFTIRLMNVTPYGYTWLKNDENKFNGQIVRRATVLVPDANAYIDPDVGFTEESLDVQWIGVKCEVELWEITPELPRRRSLYDGARWLNLEIQCKNGIYVLPVPE